MENVFLVILLSSAMSGSAAPVIPMDSTQSCLTAIERLTKGSPYKNQYLCISSDAEFIYSSTRGQIAGESK